MRITLSFIILTIVLALLITNCAEGDHDPSITVFEITKTIDHIPGNDESFFEMPQGATYHNGYVYTADISANKIIRMRSDFKTGNVIGKQGRAPGEFLGPTFVRATDEGVYVTEEGNNRLQIFDSQFTYRNLIYTRITLGQTFGVSSHNTLLLQSWSPDILVREFNEHGDTVRSFGTPIHTKPHLNNIMIETDESDNVYVAFVGTPVIRKYDFQRELVWETDLSPLIEEMESTIIGDSDGLRFTTLAFGIYKEYLYVYLRGHSSDEFGGIRVHMINCVNGHLSGEIIIKIDILRSLFGGFSFAPDGTLYFADLGNAEIVKARSVVR